MALAFLLIIPNPVKLNPDKYCQSQLHYKPTIFTYVFYISVYLITKLPQGITV